MLKKKVIASSISNLTDARYFAGWMVDVIVFNIDPTNEFYTNPQEIGAFQSWVEGPQYFLDMTEEQLIHAEKYLVDLGCQGIIIDFEKRDSISNLDIPVMYTISLKTFTENIQIIKDLQETFIITELGEIDQVIKLVEGTNEGTVSPEIYLNIEGQSLDENQILNTHISGFMLHGSPEEKVGFKSFDELDEIFEILQDF